MRFAFRIVMSKRFRLHLTHLILIFLALLQSCAKIPAPQPSPPPPAPDITDAVVESVDEFDWSLLAKPAPEPAKKPEPPPVKFPTLPALPEVPPESVVTSPEVDAVANGLKYDTVVAQRPAPLLGAKGWQYRKNSRGQIVGFEFSNRGGNRILPEHHDIGKNQHFTRDFQFRFDDRARQDIHFSVTDWVSSRDRQFRLSELMNSIFLFFPRLFVPAIAAVNANSVVTLPTGEKVEFDAKTHEIVSGVFAEAPVALNTPQFPAVEYLGKGVMVRVNSRGNDPRIATIATITNGSPDPHCIQGPRCNRCQVPAKELWEQKGAARFKFSSDEEFDRYLRARCGFGLPAVDAKSMFASSAGD
jgi:hypothetical protein